MSHLNGASRARRQSGYAKHDQRLTWRAAQNYVNAQPKTVIVRTNQITGQTTEMSLRQVIDEISEFEFNPTPGSFFKTFSVWNRPYAGFDRIVREILQEGARVYTNTHFYELAK